MKKIFLLFVILMSYNLYSETTSELDVIAINTKGLEEKLVKLQIEEFIRTRQFPLLNYVFFDQNSYYLNNYNLFKSKTEREISDFNPQLRFFNSEINEVYENVIDLIAYRLVNNPDENIEIIGYVSETELNSDKIDSELGLLRANEVKKYLTSIWGINETRINVSTTENKLPSKPSNSRYSKDKNDEENQRVEIISSFNILKPLQIMDTTIRSNPPFIKFIPKINSDKKIKSSHLYVRHRRDIMFERKYLRKLENSLTWQITKESANTLNNYGNLLYNLEVRDESSYLARIVPAPTISYVKTTISEKVEKKLKDKIYKRYNLILFDFNSNELSSMNNNIINSIKYDLKEYDNYKVYVNGFTDTLGTEEYNLKIANGRAENVKNELVKVGIDESSIIVRANGESSNPYLSTVFDELKTVTIGDRYIENFDIDNYFIDEKFTDFMNQASGRFYSRTVIIEVEIEIN